MPSSTSTSKRMSRMDIQLDARGLPPPQPLERCLDALAGLDADQRLVLWLDREPFPLYAILQRNGFHYEGVQAGHCFQVLIRRM